MHDAWLMMAACAGLLSLVPVLVRLRRGVCGTALAHAWLATVIAWLTWTGVSLATMFPGRASAGADCLWYLAAVVALVPPIAALGARRPINRAWSYFVLVPLVLVFAWPTIPAAWRSIGLPESFDIETPVLVGYLLVSLMGAGNYLGLAHTGSAVLWIAALWLVVLPLCPATSAALPDAPRSRAWGTLCLVAASWIADRQVAARRSQSNTDRPVLNRVWGDFRELFGIVWARRIMERFNEDSRRNHSPFRLGLQGLEESCEGREAAQGNLDSRAAAEVSLRWLLQKFVDPEWIDRRMPGQSATGSRDLSRSDR